MRDKSQVVLPLDLGICIDKEDFVFTLAEICESLNYDKLFEASCFQSSLKFTFITSTTSDFFVN